MISASSFNTSIAGSAWGRTPQSARVSATPIPAIRRTAYKEHVVHSSEKVLYGEVLPKARSSQQVSTQDFILERTLARAKPIIATGARSGESAQGFLQVNAYQAMGNMNPSFTESGNRHVDVYT